jgi:hypothetical protein
MTKVIATLLLALGLGCGSIENKHDDIRYEYSYDINECPTGSHSFKSKSEYCTALQDEELNKGCAREVRAKTWDEECS